MANSSNNYKTRNVFEVPMRDPSILPFEGETRKYLHELLKALNFLTSPKLSKARMDANRKLIEHTIIENKIFQKLFAYTFWLVLLITFRIKEPKASPVASSSSPSGGEVQGSFGGVTGGAGSGGGTSSGGGTLLSGGTSGETGTGGAKDEEVVISEKASEDARICRQGIIECWRDYLLWGNSFIMHRPPNIPVNIDVKRFITHLKSDMVPTILGQICFRAMGDLFQLNSLGFIDFAESLIDRFTLIVHFELTGFLMQSITVQHLRKEIFSKDLLRQPWKAINPGVESAWNSTSEGERTELKFGFENIGLTPEGKPIISSLPEYYYDSKKIVPGLEYTQIVIPSNRAADTTMISDILDARAAKKREEARSILDPTVREEFIKNNRSRVDELVDIIGASLSHVQAVENAVKGSYLVSGSSTATRKPASSMGTNTSIAPEGAQVAKISTKSNQVTMSKNVVGSESGATSGGSGSEDVSRSSSKVLSIDVDTSNALPGGTNAALGGKTAPTTGRGLAKLKNKMKKMTGVKGANVVKGQLERQKYEKRVKLCIFRETKLPERYSSAKSINTSWVSPAVISEEVVEKSDMMKSEGHNKSTDNIGGSIDELGTARGIRGKKTTDSFYLKFKVSQKCMLKDSEKKNKIIPIIDLEEDEEGQGNGK